MSEYVGEFSGPSEMVQAASDLLTEGCDLALVCGALTEAEAKAFLQVEGTGAVFRARADRLWYQTLPQDEVNRVAESLWLQHGTLDTSIGDFFIDGRRPALGQTIHIDNQNGIQYVVVLDKGCDFGAERIELPRRLPGIQEYRAINDELASRFPREKRKDLPNFGVNALRARTAARRCDLLMFLDRTMHAVDVWPGRIAWSGAHRVKLLHGSPQPTCSTIML